MTKKLLSLAALGLLLAGCLPPEPGTDDAMVEDDAMMEDDSMMEGDTSDDTMMQGDADAVMMMEGSMMMKKDDEVMMMEDDMMMEDGTTVMMDGTVKKSDGTMMQMEEGMMMEMGGQMQMMDDAMKQDMMMKVDAMMEGEAMMDSDAMYAAYDPTVLANGDTKVLFFHAAWCPICKGADSKLMSWYGSEDFAHSVYRVDYDTETELKARYGVTYQHTFVLVDGEGNLVEKVEAPTDDQLMALLG